MAQPFTKNEVGFVPVRRILLFGVDSSKSEGRNDSMLKQRGGKRSLVRGQLFTKRFLCTTSTQLALQPQVNKRRKKKAKKGQHGFWPSPENQRQFLDTISASLGVTKVLSRKANDSIFK